MKELGAFGNCDADAIHLSSTFRSWKQCKVIADFREVCKRDRGVDIVHYRRPSQWHGQLLSYNAAEAGKACLWREPI